jgi:hypothetical protein
VNLTAISELLGLTSYGVMVLFFGITVMVRAGAGLGDIAWLRAMATSVAVTLAIGCIMIVLEHRRNQKRNQREAANRG